MKYIYQVTWDGDITNYKQDFETMEDARLALAAHSKRNSVLTVKQLKK